MKAGKDAEIRSLSEVGLIMLLRVFFFTGFILIPYFPHKKNTAIPDLFLSQLYIF